MTSNVLSPLYTNCVSQGTTMNIADKRSVAFAPMGTQTGPIYYRNLTGSFTCNPSTFNAPVDDTTDYQCCFAPIPPNIYYDTNGVPIGFTKCGTDAPGPGLQSVCFPDNNHIPADILYGANRNYVYANAVNVPCSSNIFGNPNNSNVTNHCYWRQATISPSPSPSPPLPPRPVIRRPPGWVFVLSIISSLILFILLLYLTLRVVNSMNQPIPGTSKTPY